MVLRLAVLGLACLMTFSSPALADTVGQTFAATTACDGMTLQTGVASGASYTFPANGTVTSWSTTAVSGGNRMAAVVWRPAGVNAWTLVGQSALVVPTGVGLKTYSTSIPVQAGDVLAQWVEQRYGSLDVASTCSYVGTTGITSVWWYPALPFPAATPAPTSLNFDTGWLYNISAEFSAGSGGAGGGVAVFRPTVSGVSLSPSSGPSSGYTFVDIHGYFVNPTDVLVDGVALPHDQFVIDGFSDISAKLPPHPAGPVDITVRNQLGDSDIKPGDKFTYIAPPPASARSEPQQGSATPAQPAVSMETCRMPSLVGQTLKGARFVLDQAGCQDIKLHHMGTVGSKRHRHHVQSQTPAQVGTVLSPGDTVSVKLD